MASDWITKEASHAVTNLDLSLNVRAVPEIDALLSKTVLFRGKRFRPTLCMLMGQFFDLPFETLAPYARAAEFVHAATLAHDDVIDESLVRRNRPTLNARSTNARAVLAGDLLLARVMAELSSLGKIEIIHDLASTVEALVSGEWLQLEARKVSVVNREHLETVARMKTASLMAWACVTPARLAQADPHVQEACRRYGDSLGVAFQMIDDIIDYDPKGEKPFAQDIREGLVNYVTFEMIQGNPALEGSVQKLLGLTEQEGGSRWPWEPQELTAASDRVRARAQAKLEVADQCLSQVVHAMPSLKESQAEALQALRSILVYLRERLR